LDAKQGIEVNLTIGDLPLYAVVFCLLVPIPTVCLALPCHRFKSISTLQHYTPTRQLGRPCPSTRFSLGPFGL
jgi:hypothetical protein